MDGVNEAPALLHKGSLAACSQPWSHVVACLAVLGGEYADVLVGAAVTCKGGDDATVLDLDTGTKMVTVAKAACPRQPVTVPMDQVGRCGITVVTGDGARSLGVFLTSMPRNWGGNWEQGTLQG